MPHRKHPTIQPKSSVLLQSTSLARGTWLWCLQCERCYQAGEYRQVGEWQLCPYADCAGDTVVESVIWEQRRLYHPEYPVTPDRDRRYPRS